ncbi:MAG TPA: TadE/TadG family type IV pilus assembly protein [Vicinamibacterales bacterium]|nr:TadE/TadG family type IV pilus assembly protein [Vicinamibacterales bacterium]
MVRRWPAELRSVLRGTCGATAVEFAMIAPVMFGLLIGLFETSRFFYVRSSLQKAVDDAGRYAMRTTTASDSAITEVAKRDLIEPVIAAAEFKIARATVSGTDFVTVSVDYTFTPLAAIVPLGTIPVSLQARVPLVN